MRSTRVNALLLILLETVVVEAAMVAVFPATAASGRRRGVFRAALSSGHGPWICPEAQLEIRS